MLTSGQGFNSKLRDSCQAVKCPKEKPTCSRCKGRGLTCQYFATKRPGRRSENGKNTTASAASTSPTTTDSGGSRGGNVTQSLRPPLSPDRSLRDETSSLAEMRDITPITTPLPSAANHHRTNKITTNSSYFDHVALSRRLVSNDPTGSNGDNMETIDPSNIFTAFEENSGSITPDFIDFGCGDRLEFLGTSGVVDSTYCAHSSNMCQSLDGLAQPELLGQTPPNDITSLFMPDADFIGLDFGLEPSSATNPFLSSSSSSSSSRSGFSSSFCSPAVKINARDMAMSAKKTSPTGVSNTPACHCLTHAIDLLKTVSGSSSSGQPLGAMKCMPSVNSDDTESFSSLSVHETQSRRSQVILMENKQCIEAMNQILRCTGTDEDRLLLLVLCMISLKILERYSAMAWSRTHPHSTTGPGINTDDNIRTEFGIFASATNRSMSVSSDREQVRDLRQNRLGTTFDLGPSQRSDDDSLERATAQRVLGELLPVQRLVNQLSPKLKGLNSKEVLQGTRQMMPMMMEFEPGWKSQCVRGWGGRQQQSSQPLEERNPNPVSPFSAITLEHMADDLGKSLSTLSSDVINRLRQN